MANLLHRDIKPGECVVLKASIFKPQYKELKHRIFICEGGFGMCADTRGSAIYGRFEEDGEQARYEGDEDIDVKETKQLSASQETTP